MANTQIGGTDNGSSTRVAYRFRADRSSSLSAIRVYFETGSGYSGGNGGSRRITIETDAGGSPSGNVLASASVSGTQRFVTISFGSPASLTAGSIYYVVFKNTDSSPGTNFVSANALYSWDRPSPAQPVLGSGWSVLYDTGTGWGVRAGYTPILELDYSSGVDGIGYMEAWQTDQPAIGGGNAVRETFKITGSNRTVSSATVRLKLSSGSGSLTVKLVDATGTVLASDTIAASAFPTGSVCDCSSNRNAWATASFGEDVTLISGATYRLVLTAPSGTIFRAMALRQGSDYGFHPATYFSAGQMESTAGGSWSAVTAPYGGNAGQADLQFYLR